MALFTDADLSSPITEADKLFAALAEGADVAIGSRWLKRELQTERQPLLRQLYGRLFNLGLRLVLGLRYRDTQCGFKAFNRKAIQDDFYAPADRALGVRPGTAVSCEQVQAANGGSPGGMGARSSLEDPSCARRPADGRRGAEGSLERPDGPLRTAGDAVGRWSSGAALCAREVGPIANAVIRASLGIPSPIFPSGPRCRQLMFQKFNQNLQLCLHRSICCESVWH